MGPCRPRPGAWSRRRTDRCREPRRGPRSLGGADVRIGYLAPARPRPWECDPDLVSEVPGYVVGEVRRRGFARRVRIRTRCTSPRSDRPRAGCRRRVALVGAEWSGKSTLGRILVGLLRPRRGRVRLSGADPAALPARRLARRAGYVFQDPEAGFLTNTVLEEVMLGLEPGERAAAPQLMARLRLPLDTFGTRSPYHSAAERPVGCRSPARSSGGRGSSSSTSRHSARTVSATRASSRSSASGSTTAPASSRRPTTSDSSGISPRASWRSRTAGS